MSSNIEVQRICDFCRKEFTARTTKTRYCSHRCNQRAYKINRRAEKIGKSNVETIKIQQSPIHLVQEKQILTVREVAQILNCSLRSAYLQISEGKIKSVNLGQRMIRVKRSDIDRLFQ